MPWRAGGRPAVTRGAREGARGKILTSPPLLLDRHDAGAALSTPCTIAE